MVEQPIKALHRLMHDKILKQKSLRVSAIVIDTFGWYDIMYKSSCHHIHIPGLRTVYNKNIRLLKIGHMDLKDLG